jgi:predicted unusual protein kinase regulating ubiquinone biosynthesis (AarF/ABC1/UbiB family)
LYLKASFAPLQPDLRRLSLADITGDIRTTMLDELDFQKEAKNMGEFRSFLASSGNKAVMCPDVYPAASSKKVLYIYVYVCVCVCERERE